MKGLVTRRGWLRILGASTLGSLLGGVRSPAAANCPSPARLGDILPTQDDSPQRVLEKLMLGNARYVNNHPICHQRDVDQGLEVSNEGQAPAAMILSCADSRVVPEYVFDQPRARLFVCRVAGNFATNEIIGSLEYGARLLPPSGARLLMVLGHSACGAVTNTIRLIRGTIFPRDVFDSSIRLLLEALQPAVQQAISQYPPGTPEDALLRPATDEVARENAALLRARGPILAPRVQAKTLLVVAAHYEIDTGEVTLL